MNILILVWLNMEIGKNQGELMGSPEMGTNLSLAGNSSMMSNVFVFLIA